MDDESIARLEELLRRLGTTIRDAVEGSNEVKDRIEALTADGWDAEVLLDALMPTLDDDDVLDVVGRQENPTSDAAAYRLDAADARWLAAIGISPTRHRSHPQRPLPPLRSSLPSEDAED